MNFLVFGSGSIGRRHIKNLQLLGEKNIYCLKREYNSRFEADFGVKVITDVNQIDKPIDASFICTPSSLHLRDLELSKDLDCAVFIEKPVVILPDELPRVMAIAEKLKHPTFVGFMLRYHQCIMKIKEFINNAPFGNVVNARFEFGSFFPAWHPEEDYKTSYVARKELGGGVINTICHEMDLIAFLIGAPEKLFCFRNSSSYLDIAVEEQAESVMSYTDKIVSLHLDLLRKDYRRTIEITFEHGSLFWDWNKNEVIIKEWKKEHVIFFSDKNFDVNKLYVDELSDFLTIVKNNLTDNSLSIKNTIDVLKMQFAMHESIITNSPIEIKEGK